MVGDEVNPLRVIGDESSPSRIVGDEVSRSRVVGNEVSRSRMVGNEVGRCQQGLSIGQRTGRGARFVRVSQEKLRVANTTSGVA